MQVTPDLVNLFLYAAQQLGVMLGVGAQTVFLITYVLSVRDGVVDAKETQIARAVTKVLVTGLVIITLSGLAIVALHYILGQWEVLFAPAFLFKWALIVFLLTATFAWKSQPFPPAVFEGLLGATWYALFMVHIIAPVAVWFDLLVLHFIWVSGFLLLWMGSVYVTRTKEKKTAANAFVQVAQKPEPKPVITLTSKPVPPPAPKPIIKLAPPPPSNLPTQPSPPPKPRASAMPTPAPLMIKPEPPKAPPASLQPLKVIVEEHFGLPAIRVMPRTPEDAQKYIALPPPTPNAIVSAQQT